MARNRMIKVEFWSDQKIGHLTPLARLLFIGMWNFADDSGVCRANPIYLKSQVFPYDNISKPDMDKALKELTCGGLIKCAEYSGEDFLLISNFKKHQQINRPSKFRYISDNEDNLLELFNSVSTHTLLSEHSLTKVKEKVKEKVKVNDSRKPAPAHSALCKSIISHLNAASGKKYKPSTQKTQDVIKARVNDGFGLDDFIHVIDVKTEEWLNTGMEKFLRPETLFGNKFESYLNQPRQETDEERAARLISATAPKEEFSENGLLRSVGIIGEEKT